MTRLAERLGILGGTFDPIHHGHLIVASELHAALNLDRVLLVPNARSPFKQGGAMTGDAHRVAMIECAITETPWLNLSTIELERGGVSYTADTLRSIHTANRGAHIVFLMGADSLVDFHRWREPNEILRLAELGVARRPTTMVDVDSIYQRLPAAVDRVTVVPTPLIDISATDIRSRVRSGRPIRFHVPLAVERYLRQHNLYTSG